jgi:hypothetical protein
MAYEKINDMYLAARDFGASHDLAFDIAKRSVGNADDDADHDHDASEDPVRAPAGDHHHASKVADLLVEADIAPDRATALRHLLRSHDGAALLHRLRGTHKSTAKEQPMNRTEELRDIAKTYGVTKLAKLICEGNSSHGISEHEIVDLISTTAKASHPELTEAQAFSRMYTASTEEGATLRKAVNIAKLSPFDVTPVMVGGPDAMHEAVNDTEQSEAYQKLQDLAAKLRAAHPEMSAAKAFENVFTDKRNAALAAKAHRRPAATTSYPFPR